MALGVTRARGQALADEPDEAARARLAVDPDHAAAERRLHRDPAALAQEARIERDGHPEVVAAHQHPLAALDDYGKLDGAGPHRIAVPHARGQGDAQAPAARQAVK